MGEGGQVDGRKYAGEVRGSEGEWVAAGITHILPIDFCL